MDNDKQLQERFQSFRDQIPVSPRQDVIRQKFLADAQHLKSQKQRWNIQIFQGGWRGVYIPSYLRLAMVLFILVSLCMVSVVIAQQIIQIFNPVEDDNHPIPVNIGSAQAQPVNLPISFEEAMALVDFPILLPAYVPQAYQSPEIFYWEQENRLSIHYHCGSYRQLILSQIPMSSDEFEALEKQNIGILDVGASATIETIDINGVLGQYVRGTWIVQDSFAVQNISGTWVRTLKDRETGIVSTVMPGTPATAQSVWENQSELQRLYWYSDGILYILSNIGSRIDVGTAEECELNQEIYTAVARSLTLATP